MPKSKYNILLIISAVIGTAYISYLFVYMVTIYIEDANIAAKVGTTIAIALIMPHAIVTLVAVVLNIIVVFNGKSVLALLAGIFYSLAAVFFILYIPFVLAPIVLTWIGFAQLRAAQPPKQPTPVMLYPAQPPTDTAAALVDPETPPTTDQNS